MKCGKIEEIKKNLFISFEKFLELCGCKKKLQAVREYLVNFL